MVSWELVFVSWGDMWEVMYAEEVATMQHPRLRVYKLEKQDTLDMPILSTWVFQDTRLPIFFFRHQCSLATNFTRDDTLPSQSEPPGQSSRKRCLLDYM